MVGTFARVLGVVFVAVGILGFFPSLTPDGNLLGYFPVNTLHNIAHIVLGLWGLAAANSMSGAVTYMKSIAVIYALLAVLGLIAATNTLFGLMPLHGADVWLHAGLAVVAGYLGFGPPAKAVAPAA
ncbi:MAG: DUF4383 domain-containing protein [Gemmatimonadales bacterium]